MGDILKVVVLIFIAIELWVIGDVLIKDFDIRHNTSYKEIFVKENKK